MSPTQAEPGLNKESIGWSYEGTPDTVTPETIRAYAAATSDDNPRYLDPTAAGGIVAPPMYAVRLLKEVLFKPLLDSRVNANLLMLLHAGQDMRFFDLLRPGDTVHTRSQIDSIEDKSSGQILTLKMICEREGVTVVDALATLFIRSTQPRDGGGGAQKRGPSPQQPPAEPVWTIDDPITVTADQPLRYAEASLDNNPIHTDASIAQAAGLKTIILQGLCTMAFCQRTAINHAGGGQPERLKRLKVRFSKPVYPEDQLRVQAAVRDDLPGRLTLDTRVINADGQVVLKDGLAELST